MEIINPLLKKYVGQNGNDTEDEHSLVLNENPRENYYYLPEGFTGGGCNVSDMSPVSYVTSFSCYPF